VIKKLAQNEADLLHAKLFFNVDFEAEQAWKQVSPDAIETVFYAVRECLRNIHKHTFRNKEIPVEIIVTASLVDGLKILIENNATDTSIQKDDKLESSGQGLALHNALLAVFGGGLRLEYMENGISRVIISLPISDNSTLLD
jgi:signal transduction histidine kinase